MRYTFTQKFTKEIQITGLSSEEFLNLAVETSKSLGWVIGNVYNCGFTAYTNNGLFNWNAEIKLNLNSRTARLVSQSRNLNSIEYGRDEMNLENFIIRLNSLKKQKAMPELKSAYMEGQANVA